jgi:RNA polymerase sigma-70 factor (sigma-E family)
LPDTSPGRPGRYPGRSVPAAALLSAGRSSATSAAEAAVTALYQVHAVGLIRLGMVMLGDRASAEDAVQEAFCGLYRRWDRLDDPEKALPYVRSAVLNGCRSQLRSRIRARRRPPRAPVEVGSAESAVILAEEHREVLDALRRLPVRQREALVLRYYLDLPPAEVARSMNIGEGTVKSTTSRALAALGRLLREDS